MAISELNYRYSVDLDGTLYHFKGEGEGLITFGKSEFAQTIRGNTYRFLQERLGKSEVEAIAEFDRIYTAYNSEVSLAVEQEYGIDRYDYFRATWDVDPADFISPEGNVREAISVLQGRMALLTAAPRIWAIRAITFLKVDDLFTTIYTGEPDIRKPSPEIFRQVVADFDVPVEYAVSIGDQDYSDIKPAKSIGMKAIRKGPEIGSADARIDSIQELVPTLQTFGWI